MRSIPRIPVQVPTLFDPEEGSGFAKAQEHRQQFEAGDLSISLQGSNNLSFTDHWNKADVRGALYAQQGWVCAYCGIELRRGDRGDVEHFRPKQRVDGDEDHGGYWWLAYEFGNYVLSCGPCNRNRKRAEFPLVDDDAERVTFCTRERLPEEARLLLDPVGDVIEDLIRVDLGAPGCPVRPAEDLTPAEQERIEKVVAFYRLNRDVTLLRERQAVADEVLALIEAGQFQDAAEYAIRFRPHSFVARQILVEGGFADCLPEEETEVRWLFAEIVGILSETVNVLELFPDDRLLREELDELLWSVTALVASGAGDVEAMLALVEQLGLTEKVEDRKSELVA
jgi:uncharacterized protein (TIGR02646 family)